MNTCAATRRCEGHAGLPVPMKKARAPRRIAVVTLLNSDRPLKSSFHAIKGSKKSSKYLIIFQARLRSSHTAKMSRASTFRLPHDFGSIEGERPKKGVEDYFVRIPSPNPTTVVANRPSSAPVISSVTQGFLGLFGCMAVLLQNCFSQRYSLLSGLPSLAPYLRRYKRVGTSFLPHAT